MTTIKKSRSDKYKQIEEQTNIEIQEEIEEKEETAKHPLLKKIIILFFILIISLFIYMRYIETKIIEIKEYKIENTQLPPKMNGLKIIHFSDIHYGTTINTKELNKIIKKINQLKPDLIFFTGDLIDTSININDQSKQEIIGALNKLTPTLNTYAIYGNEDKDTYKEIIEQTNIKLLNNESTLIYYKDIIPIEIIGFNTIENNPDYTLINNPIENIDTSTFYKIILAHEPDSFTNIKNYNINLLLSGGTLGNNINIPGIKNLFINDNAKNYFKEYYKENNIDFYISNGLGTNDLKLRFNNKPSINFYRMYSQN